MFIYFKSAVYICRKYKNCEWSKVFLIKIRFKYCYSFLEYFITYYWYIGTSDRKSFQELKETSALKHKYLKTKW